MLLTFRDLAEETEKKRVSKREGRLVGGGGREACPERLGQGLGGEEVRASRGRGSRGRLL